MKKVIQDSRMKEALDLLLEGDVDLPNLPTHISIVKPPKGTEIINGIVKDGNFGGSGKGTQFYFTKKIDPFSFEKSIKIGN